MEDRGRKIVIQLLVDNKNKCPVCEQRLFRRIIPKTKIKAMFCNKCYGYFVKENDELSENSKVVYLRKSPTTMENRGKKGYCVKCGEKVYNNQIYCFECFKREKTEY